MRKLPFGTDADLVIEIGSYLDGHGKCMPVSIVGAKAVLRERLPRRVPKRELERLLVEMCSTRGLSVLFDESELTGRSKFGGL